MILFSAPCTVESYALVTNCGEPLPAQFILPAQSPVHHYSTAVSQVAIARDLSLHDKHNSRMVHKLDPHRIENLSLRFQALAGGVINEFRSQARIGGRALYLFTTSQRVRTHISGHPDATGQQP